MNTWKKYIVEIFVIVFSILAAFWLEGFRDELQNKNEFKTLMANLCRDLKHGSEQIKNNIKGTDRKNKIIENGLEKLTNHSFSDEDKDTIKQAISIVPIVLPILNDLDQYVTILNSGKFDLKKSKVLDKIYSVNSSYNTKIAIIQKLAEDLKSQETMYVHPFVEFSINFPGTRIDDFIPEDIVDNKPFLNTMRRAIIYGKMNNQFLSDLLIDIGELLAMIEEPLDKIQHEDS